MNILSHNYHIIILTETWLNANIGDNEIIDQRYQLFRCDRDQQATGRQDGGGVMVAVLRGLGARAVRLGSPSPPSCSFATLPLIPSVIDYISIELKLGNEQHFINAVYIPPKQPPQVYELFTNYLQNLLQYNIKNYHLFGDYNLPTIEWVYNTASHTLDPIV